MNVISASLSLFRARFIPQCHTKDLKMLDLDIRHVLNLLLDCSYEKNLLKFTFRLTDVLLLFQFTIIKATFSNITVNTGFLRLLSHYILTDILYKNFILFLQDEFY